MVDKSCIVYHKKGNSNTTICGLNVGEIYLDKHSKVIKNDLTVNDLLDNCKFNKEEIEFCRDCLFKPVTTYE